VKRDEPTVEPRGASDLRRVSFCVQRSVCDVSTKQMYILYVALRVGAEETMVQEKHFSSFYVELCICWSRCSRCCGL